MLNSADIEERQEVDDIVADAKFDDGVDRVEESFRNSRVEAVPSSPPPKDRNESEGSYTQWALGGNGRFTPVGASVPELGPGVYEPFTTPSTWGLEKLNINSDEVYELPDMVTNEILAEAETFWNSEHLYKKHNLLYKRGIIMHGPPGGGKTVTIKMLIKELIKRKGIVLITKSVGLTSVCLKVLKRIEPERNLICIFEDIDEIISAQGEADVLSMLDGEHNVSKVMNIATTNYPDRLGARLINRPSRFDRSVYVGMPGANARLQYLKYATSNELSEQDANQWVKDTEGFSIAHLRELVAAVFCLQQPYKDVITRLVQMATRIKTEEGFKNGKGLGFNHNRTAAATSGTNYPS